MTIGKPQSSLTLGTPPQPPTPSARPVPLTVPWLSGANQTSQSSATPDSRQFSRWRSEILGFYEERIAYYEQEQKSYREQAEQAEYDSKRIEE